MAAEPRARMAVAVGALAFTRLASALVQAVALVLVARSSRLSDFGMLTSTLAVALFLSVVFEMGLDTYCTRCLATGDLQRASWVDSLHFILAICAAIVGAGVILVGSAFWGWSLALVLLPAMALAERRLLFRLNNLVAVGRPDLGTIPVLAARIAALGLLWGGLSIGGAQPTLLYGLAGVGGGVLAIALLRKHVTLRGDVPTAGDALEILRASTHLWVATLSGQLRSLDVPLVNALASSAVAGVYALPARAVAPMRLLGTSLAAVTYPMASRGERKPLLRINRSLMTISLLSIGLLALGWSIVPTVVSQVVGGAYANSGGVLRVFAIGVIVNLVGSVMSSELQGLGESRFVARMGMGLVPLFFIGTAAGVWLGGAVGAAWGSTATFLVQAVVSAWRLRRLGWLA